MMDDSIHILLIEDDPAHAELIQRAFEDSRQERAGTQVQLVVTHTLREAREYLHSHKPILIIADWRLPDGDSKTVLEEQGALKTPVIIMTSYGSERNAVEAMRSGALDYIIKSSESMMDMPHIAQRAIERWQTHVTLAERDRQFRLLAENSSDIISLHDNDGIFLYVSPACQTIIGYDPEELIGRDVITLVHPDDAKDLLELFRSTRVDDPTMAIPYRARHKNGEYIWLETTARIIYGLDHHAVEIQASSRDITERKQVQVALQRAHADLQDAYDKTIEGWVLALDLRDRETEGHTQRVTEMTLKLARELGCTEEEVVHIRRGALLHDIGKMGVPDKLLHKPGPLADDEWVEMRKHPDYAYQMLSRISYLHQALIIPYYHHERWDGSGYPHKLAGEDIPLFARLFAVVDVWDALSSDRPYRKRMPPKDVVEYLQKESGRLFDPFIVEKFLQLVQIK